MKTMLGILVLAFAIAGGLPRLRAENQQIRAAPDYQLMMLANQLVPGSAQVALGQRRAGILYMTTALPLSIAGQAMLLWYVFLDLDAFAIEPMRQNDKTYLFDPALSTVHQEQQWLLYTGFTLSVYSSLLSTYSSYAAHRDYHRLYVPSYPLGPRMPLAELIAAPYRLQNLISWDVFPFFPMSVVASLAGEDFAAIGRFFGKNRVEFWGIEVTPIFGLMLNTLFTFCLVTANAVTEEVLFRGLNLETSGPVRSSLTFGLAHLPNMLMPGASIEDTILQTANATLFAFHAARQTLENGYDFSKMITLHFWHNILAFTFGYLISQGGDEPSPFSVSLHLSL